MRSVLDILGQKYNTNKSSVWNGVQQDIKGYPHRYLPFYESFFSSIRDKPVTFLEIGVEHCSSLRMWRDYFPLGTIVGMDKEPMVHLSEERMIIECGNQHHTDDLDRVAAKHGPFDVILDDAGHETPVQIMCYDYMAKYVRPGGFYVLEDIMDTMVVDHLNEVSRAIVLSQVPWIESISFSYGTSVTKFRA